jgi:hypothetical protein
MPGKHLVEFAADVIAEHNPLNTVFTELLFVGNCFGTHIHKKLSAMGHEPMQGKCTIAERRILARLHKTPCCVPFFVLSILPIVFFVCRPPFRLLFYKSIMVYPVPLLGIIEIDEREITAN